ncbi:MAG: ribosomal protein S18-alanine N-acetyltransferase [Burkholderiales bacterium]|nr:ribosomal protein S18-alanine N-acetyltransferase [Burkholderiales bacterium]
MGAGDLDVVTAIERDIYSHPWTPGNFRDSLDAGYHCWILECASVLAGYTIVAVAAAEAHLLNLSVARSWQGRGYGRELLAFALRLARDYGAGVVLLEVRPSNAAARALYAAAGFAEIGVRHGYYPAEQGREDAIVLRLALR